MQGNKTRKERSGTVYNQGNHAATVDAQRRGYIGDCKKVWLTAYDDRVCKICDPLDGRAVNMTGNFPGGLLLPPAHPNCRCTVIYEEITEPTAPGNMPLAGLTTESESGIISAEVGETRSDGVTYTYPDDEKTRALSMPGIRVSNERTLQQALDGFTRHAQQMDEPFKSVYTQYAGDTLLQPEPLRAVGVGYDTDTDAIVYNPRFLRLEAYQQPGNTVFGHELAHRYDFTRVHSWEDNSFISAISRAEAEISENPQKYKQLYAEHTSLNPAYQDILSAISRSKFKVDFGHEGRYWNDMTQPMEIFADLFYLQANRISLPPLDGLLDDVIRAFNRLIGRGI